MNKTRGKRKGIKVLFIYPNPMMDNLIPINISLLSACLKKAGHQTKLFDTTFYDTGGPVGDDFREKNLQVIKTDLSEHGITRIKTDIKEDFRKMVDEYKPDLIALSVFEISYKQGLMLLKDIKKDHDILTIVGGVFATFSSEDVIREDCVDIVCVGEGEDALVELCNKLRDKKDITKIKNLWVKKDGKIYKNDLRPLKNLDNLPLQDWTIYDTKRLYKPFLGDIKITGGFETARGCVHNCAFCCNPGFRKLYKGKGIFFRIKSPERIVEEVKHFKKKYNLSFIKFVDADFLCKSEKTFLKFVKLYKKVKVPFWCEARAENITEKRVKLLESIGCEGMALGLESGNETIRNKLIKKNLKRETIIKAFKILRKSKMRICVNVIIGFPFESRKEIFDTIRLVRELNIDNPIVNIFNPYRGTELHEICVKEGFMSKDTLAGDYRGEFVLDMPQITKEELYGIQRAFPLYVKFPRILYPLIRLSERSDLLFKIFSKIYTWMYL